MGSDREVGNQGRVQVFAESKHCGPPDKKCKEGRAGLEAQEDPALDSQDIPRALPTSTSPTLPREFWH